MSEVLLKQILQGINEIKEEQVITNKRLISVEERVSSIEEQQHITNLNLKAMTQRLDSFKFDVDYLIEKQSKTEIKVNRIEKIIEN